MKSLFLCVCSIVALTQSLLAGGNTAFVEIDKVTKITVEWFYAKTAVAVFEVVPYFTHEIRGVPTGGHSEAELKRLSDKWWVDTHADGLQIKKGDAIRISYQGDQTTINGVEVTKIVGYGSVRINDE